jgi:3'5'-cyclic nucleotide phosphodiesterase
MGNGRLSSESQLEIFDIVDRLRDISGRSESDFEGNAVFDDALDLWAAEVRCLRDQETKLTEIITLLLSTLHIAPENPLSKAATLAALHAASQDEEPDYHNKFHVAEVVIAAYMLGRRENLDKIQLAELLIAATAHDFSHSGTNNRFDFEREMVSVETIIPLLQEAGLPFHTVERISRMILATDFKVGVPPAREEYRQTRHLPMNNERRVSATQALLLTEADVLFSCFDLEYNDLLSKLLSVEWKTGASNLSLKARLGFLNYVQFISSAAHDIGIDDRRRSLIARLSAETEPEQVAGPA